MAFPDPTHPIATCTRQDCEGCPVASGIQCHVRRKDLVHFPLASVPGFIAGGIGLLLVNGWLLAAWVAIALGFFRFLQVRVMCPHCPHYTENGHTLACRANHGSPKVWTYRPGPMSPAEIALIFGGVVAVWGYPSVVLAVRGQGACLAALGLLSTGFFVWLEMRLCPRCMNFACPRNAVDGDARERFFRQNPSVAEHWR